MNHKLLLVVIGMVLVLGCATAQAGTIRAEDDDIDFLLNPDLTPKTTGSFATGDVLVSVFELNALTVDASSVIPAGSEVTGIAVIQITGGDGSLATPFTFSPYTGGLNAVSPVDVADGDAGEGAMIAMWRDSSPDLALNFATDPTTNCTSLADCLTRATDGSLLQVDGFAGDLDEFWRSSLSVLGGSNVDTVAGLSGSLQVASLNAALTTFENHIPTSNSPILFQTILTGLPCAGSVALDGCIAGPTVNGLITGGLGLNSALYDDGAFARSDTDASKLVVVPEPATLTLMGIGLLGLAATLRRRR